MKLSIITPNGFLKHLWPELYKMGFKLLINSVSADCDKIICFSISQVNGLKQAHAMFPLTPIVNYHWDIYRWHLEKPRENDYDWDEYKRLCLLGDVWVPSVVTQKRTQELLGLESRVIKTFSVLYDYPVQDKDYILLPWREMPDNCYGWAKKACQELKIPFKEPCKRLPWEDWKKTVAECSFIVSDHEEASTGSMAMVEAAYLGKHTISNGSELSAAKEYLNGTGDYFNTYLELKSQIKKAWKERPSGTLNKEWVRKEYSPETMAKRLNKLL